METEKIYRLFCDSEGITTDTRSVKKGEIFFALWGEKYNGNEFASEALEKGASWAVIDDPAFESDRTILVDDCLAELQKLASWHRKQLGVPVLAITGTNGKTTTKELAAAVLSRKFRVHYTKGNLNNHIGVPLTILSAPAGTEMMIIEMGANHGGEIRALTRMAGPGYGIITNIGTAHIEGFGSYEGVVRAKCELYEYLREVNGVAIYDDDNPLLTEKIYKLVNRAVPYSDPTGTDLVVEALDTDLNLKLKVSYQNKIWQVSTDLFGNYNLVNIKAAMATGLFFGVEIEDVIDAISSYRPGNNRSQVRETGRNTVICDSYNANPVSMRMALNSFKRLEADVKTVILGDMLELGDTSREEHEKILGYLTAAGFSNVLLVGGEFAKLAAETGFRSFAGTDQLKEFLERNPLTGHYILVKGSRGIALEKIYDLL